MLKRPHVCVLIFGLCLLQGCVPLIIGGAAGGALLVHDRRTTGTVVEDQAIEMRISGAISQDEELVSQSHINVVSYNNAVLLTGEAPTEALRDRAGQIAESADKVRVVYNELMIAAPSALSARSSDGWITSKVKTALVGLEDVEGFSSARVKVTTEGGVVYLMGLVHRKEVEPITEAARQVGGVKRVVRLFEYLD